MGIDSINEPGQRTLMLTPVSINETPHMPEPPVITALDPDQCVIGGPDFTLDITGTGFYPASVIFFAGHDEPTTLNEDGVLSTGVKPSLWAEPCVVQCQIRNGPVFSNAVDFTFNAVEGDDPDELEEEIEASVADGDIKPLHRGRPSKTLKRK